MKNKKNIFLIICIIILLVLVVLGILLYKNNNLNNAELIGYYKLEKVTSYYKTGNEEKINEQNTFYNDKKLNIMVDKIESKILNTGNYYYLIKDNKIYYSLNEIDKDKLDNVLSFEFEISDNYLILVERFDVTNTYYYKKINKEEY